MSWESGEGVRVGGRVSEKEGSLSLQGFVGEKLVSANIAVVNDFLHIFTQVTENVYIFTQATENFYIFTQCLTKNHILSWATVAHRLITKYNNYLKLFDPSFFVWCV